jgi:FkbM family methyltransferase
MMSARIASAQVVGIATELSFAVHERDDKHVSERIATEGIWEPFETELIRRLTRPGDLFVDCGANIGWYSVVAGTLGATVVAFEPMPANAALARQNITRNDLGDRVTLHECGLGAEPKRATLELSAFNQGDHRVTAVPGGRKPTVEIQIVRLDDVLRDAHDDQRPDLLKLDTQGSEVAILNGGRRAWAPRPGVGNPVIVLEFWPYGLQQCGASVAELNEMLAELIDITHRCFEIVEWRTALDPLSLADVQRMATIGGYSAEMKGFTNLLLVPIERTGEIADLTTPR